MTDGKMLFGVIASAMAGYGYFACQIYFAKFAPVSVILVRKTEKIRASKNPHDTRVYALCSPLKINHFRARKIVFFCYV